LKKIRLEKQDLQWIKDIVKILDEEFGRNGESVFAEDDKGNRFIIQVLGENKIYIEMTLNESFLKEE